MAPQLDALSEIETTVMQVFWDTESPLTIVQLNEEFYERYPNIRTTIHNIVSRLERKGYISVHDRVRVNNRYAHTYFANITAEVYLEQQIEKNLIYKKNPNRILAGIVAHLIEDERIDDQTLDEMQSMIDARRKGRK